MGEIILRKRERYRAAFDNFDPALVAKYDQRRIKKLLGDEGIVRNRLKIDSAVGNAKAFLAIQKEFGSFDEYAWRFVKGRTIKRKRSAPSQAVSAESDALSADLKRRGFKFVGSTICYSFMQAIGMVNDHEASCFRYHQLKSASPASAGSGQNRLRKRLRSEPPA